MMRFTCRMLFVLAVCAGLGISPAWAQGEDRVARDSQFHNTTEWHVQPSLKYDVLCLLNVLSGDPFYLKYYQADFDELSPTLTPEVRAALGNLKRKIKDEKKNIISAFLTLYFSAADGDSLADLQRAIDDSGAMQRRLRETPYYSDEGWALLESVKPDLRVILTFLEKSNFESYWRSKILPKIQERIDAIQPELPKYNVIHEAETVLGHPLPSGAITVYMLYYSQPHGIRITGTRFLTDVAWPFNIVLRNAVHEMLHPPFQYAEDPELREALNKLRTDPFLMDKVENHNPAFGYNSFEGLVEEDCVQALEQVITDKWSVSRDPQARWRQNDDGIHVFAVALYSLMKAEDFGSSGKSFRSFLLEALRAGKFSDGKLKGIVEAFLAPSTD